MSQSKSIIGAPSIRIVLLKTAVGFERKVYRFFQNVFQQHNITDWWAFKLFGEYDICLILKKTNDTLDQILLNAGTTEGVTHSTEMLCYLWGKSQEAIFNTSRLNSPTIAINILKLKPSCLRDHTIRIESALSGFLRRFPKIFCLGTFGWSEFVLIYPCRSFNKLYDDFLEDMLAIHLKGKGTRKTGIFLKSFTLVGVNYNLLYPKIDCSILKNRNNNINKNIYPTVRVACRPSEITEIRDYFLKQFGLGKKEEPKNSLTVGAYDFVISHFKDGTWGDFVEKMLTFRERKRESLFKTSIQLSINGNPPATYGRAWLFKPFCINVTPELTGRMEKFLGHPAQESILATIYTFNQYLQNELLADSMQDMIDYVLHMVYLATNRSLLQIPEIQQALEHMPMNIKYGCNQRLSGFLLQEGVEDFSPYKGGKQKILKALKALCIDMLADLDVKWFGFVIIGREYSYDHAALVLSIPVDAAFKVDGYFGLFHEIGHVLISRRELIPSQGRILEAKIPAELAELFDDLGDISREIFCDLFDYQCGFLGDYKLYRKTVPQYLAKLLSKKNLTIDEVEHYVLRNMCVTLYANHNSHRSFDTKKLQRIARNELYVFISLAGLHDPNLANNIGDLVQRIAYSASQMRQIISVFERTYRKHFKRFCDKRLNKFNSRTYKEQFEMILNGEIVDELDHPQLVVLSMLKYGSANLSYKSHVAAIQSMLNCYYKKDWDGSYHPYIDVPEKSTH